MDKKVTVKEAIEAARTAIENKMHDDMARNRRIMKYAFISVGILILVSSLYAAIMIPSPQRIIPDGCSVVDNISTCHMEQQTYFLPLGKIFVFYPEFTRVCEKKLVCYDGRVSEWP